MDPVWLVTYCVPHPGPRLVLHTVGVQELFGEHAQGSSPGCPGILFVDQAGLELRDSPVSASQVLGLKVCATTA